MRVFFWKNKMTIVEKLVAGQAAIDALQAQIDDAKAKLAIDQAAYDDAQPHLSNLAKIEEYFASMRDKIGAELHDESTALVAKIRTYFN